MAVRVLVVLSTSVSVQRVQERSRVRIFLAIAGKPGNACDDDVSAGSGLDWLGTTKGGL